MNKAFTIALFLLLFQLNVSAQTPSWQWAKTITDTADNTITYGNACTTDKAGNVFLTGSFFADSISFGAVKLYNSKITSQSDPTFLVKFNPAGNALWGITSKGDDYEAPYNMAADSDGNIFITGFLTSQNAIFGNDTLHNTPSYSNQYTDIYLAKCDGNGNFLWARSLRGNFTDYVFGLATDKMGNAIITGCFYSDTLKVGSINLINNGNGDYRNLFIAKYDKDGEAVWAKSSTGGKDETGTSVATDDTGNVFLTGNFTSDTCFLGGKQLLNANKGSLAGNFFIAKYDVNGNVRWAKSVGGKGFAEGLSVTVFNNKPFAEGDFSCDSLLFGVAGANKIKNDDQATNTSDIFVVSYNAAGNVLWAKSTGGKMEDQASTISSDRAGNIFITGNFYSGTFPVGYKTLYNKGASDIIIEEYDAAGNLLSGKSIGGNNTDLVRSIALDNQDNIYIAGIFASDTLNFDNVITLSNPSEKFHPFIAKYGYPYITSADNVVVPGNSISVYPNPAANRLTVIGNRAIREIKVEDVIGQTVLTENINAPRVQIDVSGLTDGLYFLSVIYNNGSRQVSKFVKD